jgi:hypothetical protein
MKTQAPVQRITLKERRRKQQPDSRGTDPSLLLDRTALALRWGVSPCTIGRYDDLPEVRLGTGKIVRYKLRDIEAYEDRNRVRGGEA